MTAYRHGGRGEGPQDTTCSRSAPPRPHGSRGWHGSCRTRLGRKSGRGCTRLTGRVKDMQQHMVIKAMLGGLLGTLGQILLVYGVAPLMAGQALELAALRGLPCALGLLTHIVSGSVLLPLGYLAVPPHDVPAPAV